MLISYRWLQRHVDLSGISPAEVAGDLTIHTAEVEGINVFAPHLGEVVVGHVLECEQHPDADRLRVTRVDVGDGEPLQIVCGAPNMRVGLKVAVGRVGCVLPGDFKLKKSKIRGVASHGMVCSVKELELGDDHDGIWELPESCAVGISVAEAMDMGDTIIEIDNKSLTHRPDLWGHRGIAGEVAAIRGLKLKPLDLSLPECGAGDPYPVAVESAGCMRYIGLPISNVRVERSPAWLRQLLLAVGQRPIDLLVDLSNFVMLDIAQPTHLFDLHQLSSAGILVRNAREGESIVTLDECERALKTSDMLITSGGKPVAVAGVMGGQGSKVAEGTGELLLEAAAFDPTIVRRTSAHLGLRTDASARYEKFLDPTLPLKAAGHLVRTLQSIQPEIQLPRPMGDAGDWKDPAMTLELRPARVRAVLGAPIDDDEIERMLSALGFGVARSAESWRIDVPSARATKDVGIEADLIEEVGRLFGYDRIAEVPLVGEIVPPRREHRRQLVRTLQDRLSGAAHFSEAMTHSFQAEELLQKLGALAGPHVRVLNPQMEGYGRIRRDLAPSLLGVLPHNRRQRAEVRLYEVGKGYRPEHSSERGEPQELHQLALVWCAPKPGKQARFDSAVFPRLQAVVEDLIQAAGRVSGPWRAAQESELDPWVHPGRCVVREGAKGEVLVRLAALEPGAQRELGLVGELDAEVALAELSIDALLRAEVQALGYRPLPRFPGVKVDVALALEDHTPAAEALAAIELAGKGLVACAELFDLYRGPNLGAGKKSLAYHVLLQSPNKTLSDGDSAKFLGRLERAIEQLGGELRKE